MSKATQDLIHEACLGRFRRYGSGGNRFVSRSASEFSTASVDQNHLKSVTVMNCDIPDRSSAISRNDDGPLIAMIEGIASLEKVGVDFIAIPCNTAMYWFEKLSDFSSVPILNIVTETGNVMRMRVSTQSIFGGPTALIITESISVILAR